MDAHLARVELHNAGLHDAESVHRVIAQARKESRTLDLNESWAALHFLLTSEYPLPRYEAVERGIVWDDDSLENVLMGGDSTAYRTSFGVARYLSPSQVRRMYAQLSKLAVEEFIQRYDAETFIEEGIPPDRSDDSLETRHWLEQAFKSLVEFYRLAATNDDGVLIYFS